MLALLLVACSPGPMEPTGPDGPDSGEAADGSQIADAGSVIAGGDGGGGAVPPQERCSGIGYRPKFACCPGLVYEIANEGRPDEIHACCLRFWLTAQDGVHQCTEPRAPGGECKQWFQCVSSVCSEGWCL